MKQCAFIFVLAIFCDISLRRSENRRAMEREQNWHVNNNVQLEGRNLISLSKPERHPIKHRKHVVPYFFSQFHRNFFNFKVKSRFNKIYTRANAIFP